MPAPNRRAATRDRLAFAEQVCAVLARAQDAGVPVHVATARSKQIAVGYMVSSATPGADGKVALVHTRTGQRFTPKPTDVRFVASLLGDVASRPGSISPLADTDRAQAVATALMGLGLLLSSDELTDAERADLERLAGGVARYSAG